EIAHSTGPKPNMNIPANTNAGFGPQSVTSVRTDATSPPIGLSAAIAPIVRRFESTGVINAPSTIPAGKADSCGRELQLVRRIHDEHRVQNEPSDVENHRRDKDRSQNGVPENELDAPASTTLDTCLRWLRNAPKSSFNRSESAARHAMVA